MEKKVIPVRYDTQDMSISNTEKAFKSIFTETLSITTTNVRTGRSSAVIYVPKRYVDKIATVIIWDKPVKYYEDLLKDKTSPDDQVGPM